MAQKWNLQDIKPPERDGGRPRKPLRRTRPHTDMQPRRKPVREREEEQPEEDDIVEDYSSDGGVEIIDGNARKRKRVVVSAGIAAVILVVGLLFSFMMSGAELTIYPKHQDVNIQATFTAATNPSASDELAYELLSIDVEGERQVAATGEEQVSTQAEGTIFIYNAMSPNTQRLVKNTRFESPEGYIYRTFESVEVPGYITDENGDIAPGVTTARVFAVETGAEYNVAPTQFTIPGFRGGEEYEKIWAESTDSFSGGFEGKRFIIDDAELQTTKQALHQELRDTLLQRLPEERPAGMVIFDEAITFNFTSLPATEYGDDLATIKERASLHVPMFKESEFADYLAKNTIAGYETADVLVEDLGTLQFAYADPAVRTTNLSALDTIEFDLSGSALIIWQYDEVVLINDLTGLPKTAMNTVLPGYPAIDTATVVIRPFWKQSFPDNPNDIEVIRIVGEKAEEN